MNSQLQVLIVEDDADVAMACEQALQLEGLECGCMSSAELAQKHLPPEFAGVVLTDIRLPRMSGLELMAFIHAMDAELPVILMTGHGDIGMAVQAMKDGASDFLEKPFAPEKLVQTVRRALEKRRLVLEVRGLREHLQSRDSLQQQLLGQSHVMQALRRTMQSLASSEADVLVWGETGTGKERVARSLHESSNRKDGHFVAINCGGLPETLFDSEMFGSEAGAFTGAGKKRIGKIEHANGGTLFLDEIESMPMPMQTKLLRVLQERVLERLGSNTLIPVDCRVIAATKVDLLELSERGLFRADLYYRLNVVTLNLPPLRERREDIPLLFEHFALQAAARHHRDVPDLTTERLQVLMAHRWPGNVRELRNLTERITLGIEMGLGNDNVHMEADASLASTVEAIERTLIAQALRSNDGSLTRAAIALNTPKTTLHDKIKKYNLG